MARIAKRLGFYIPVKERQWKGEEWTEQEQVRRRKEACRHFGLIDAA